MAELNQIKEIVQQNLATEFVEAETKDNIHFYLTVVSKSFEGLSRIKQHKLVLDLFNDKIKQEEIHALSVKTFTPEKWKSLQSMS